MNYMHITPKTSGFVVTVNYERPKPSEEFAYSDLDDMINGLIRLLGPVQPAPLVPTETVEDDNDDGWRVWEGGPRPPPGLKDTDMVEVRLGGGEEYGDKIPQPVTIWTWQWRHHGTKDDIVGYRVVKP